jgi:hypothetical protein
MEIVRYLVWLRLYRARKIQGFFKKMEKDIRISYLFTRIVKLVTVELYCTHTAACIFYYLATTLPPAHEGGTWIGSLTMGDRSYINFRHVDLLTRYITSLYLAIVTMATVGTRPRSHHQMTITSRLQFLISHEKFMCRLRRYTCGEHEGDGVHRGVRLLRHAARRVPHREHDRAHRQGLQD